MNAYSLDDLRDQFIDSSCFEDAFCRWLDWNDYEECEACGLYSDKTQEHNGDILCPDCRQERITEEKKAAGEIIEIHPGQLAIEVPA